MATKKTIVIDQETCIGCSQCVDSCPGGALAMVDGKAKLVDANHCDGLGVCIGECPVDAITFEDIPIEAPTPAEEEKSPCGCPGSAHQQFTPPAPQPAAPKSPCGCPGGAHQEFPQAKAPAPKAEPASESALQAWPIMLHLVQPTAPQFQGADVLIAASCSAFSHGGFHADMLEGRGLVIACPKLDNQQGYIDKLTALFQLSQPRSVTVVRMEVPCCIGLTRLVLDARQAAGSELPITETVVALRGGVISEQVLGE